jgi:hypothetical protein
VSIYLSIYLSMYLSIDLPMALQPFVGPWPLFQFFILYTVGRAPWTRDETVARPLLTHGTTQTHNNRIQTSMPRVGFEHTMPVFEWVETVHDLERAATLISSVS